jgi:psiF repeat
MNLLQSTTIAALVGALMSFGGLVATTGPSEAAKAKVQRSAKSLECSAQADTKNLHGKVRKSFRKKCMRGKAT